MMANRMWCETGAKYLMRLSRSMGQASLQSDPPAGDSENYLPCPVPSEGAGAVPPFLSVIAFNDYVVGNTPEENMNEKHLGAAGSIYTGSMLTFAVLLNDW